jgi:3-phenylpropionate/trans-cinnamate dioxygenase ferredoxin reductase subunit
MADERIVIVGAGPSGLATARAYREHGGSGSVTLVGEELLLPYRRPPLTKDFLRGELDAGELPLEQVPWFTANDVRPLLGTRAVAIDPDRGAVSLEDGEELEAEAIVLASGSEPVRPQLPGFEDGSIMTMRTLPDSLALAERAREGDTVSVIGSGFIGCEIAASLAMRGASVTLIGEETLPQRGRLGEEVAKRLAAWLIQDGVRLLGGVAVSAIDHGRTVVLEDVRRIDGSCVVLGMGARPRGQLARDAGLPMHADAVLVDGSMRACADAGSGSGSGRVLAVGDVAHALNLSAGRHLRVEHWGDALAHGEIAGRTLAGVEAAWEEVPGFWSTIGRRTLKYAAWGDGYEECRVEDRADGGFSAWYERGGVCVGVLTHACDRDYERGRELIRRGASVR